MITGSCSIINDPEHDPDQPEAYGTIVISFIIPKLRGDPYDPRYPVCLDNEIHRYHLNIYDISADPDSDEYLCCAGVSRHKQFYTFNLAPGKYQYKAVIICNGQQSQCEFIGFPDGKYLSIYGQFEIQKDHEKTIE